MLIDLESVKELQQILFEEYEKILSLEETKLIGEKLINLYQSLLNKNNTYDRQSKSR